MSTIQKSASLPIDRLPLLIFKILAGLFVNALIIVSNFMIHYDKVQDLKTEVFQFLKHLLQLEQKLIF